MAKPCSICRRAEVANINDALISGDASLREIAASFSLSKSALSRHQPHVTKAVRKAESLEDVLDQIQRWSEEAVEVVGQILSREPAAAGRISKRKTASRRRPTALSSLKKC